MEPLELRQSSSQQPTGWAIKDSLDTHNQMILVRHCPYRENMSSEFHKKGWGVRCFNRKVVGHSGCWVSADRLHLGLEGDRLLLIAACNIYLEEPFFWLIWFPNKFYFFPEGLPWISTLLPANEAGQGIFTVSDVQNSIVCLLQLPSPINYPRSTPPSQFILHIRINFWWEWDQLFDDINP